MDALEFLRSRADAEFDGVLHDPPYSFRQASECYKGNGKDKLRAIVTRQDYWSQIKNEVARVIKPRGYAICFGWNSNGIGKRRGFKLERVVILAHGGSQHDTLITVERKIG